MKTLIVLLLTLAFGFNAVAGEVKEWTILTFLNGNNNLDPYGEKDIIEMEKVGSTNDVNLVVQWASLKNGSTKRLLVKKARRNSKVVVSPIVEDIGNVDMGIPQTLVDFVAWGVKNYPAKRYFVNVWDHGSGWHLLALRRLLGKQSSGFFINDISHDENTGNVITTKQLGEALNQISHIIGKKIDLYGSDACLMGMAEVAGEMKDSVEVFAGSQETEPLEGWPYDKFLKKLVSKPSMGPLELGKILTEEYIKSYSGGSQGTKQVTFSIFDMSKYDNFVSAMKTFSDEMIAGAPANKASVMEVAQKTQAFQSWDYKDLVHFVDLLDSTKSNAVSPAARANLKKATLALISSNGTTKDYKDARGLSIWLPTESYYYDAYRSLYQTMDFDRATNWGGALFKLQ